MQFRADSDCVGLFRLNVKVNTQLTLNSSVAECSCPNCYIIISTLCLTLETTSYVVHSYFESSTCIVCTVAVYTAHSSSSCQQTLSILFFRPQSSLNCRMLHLNMVGTHSSPAWWGLTLPAHRDRLEAYLRRSTALGFRPATAPTLGTIYSEAGDKLFEAIALNPFHLHHDLLPPRRDTHYSPCTRHESAHSPNSNYFTK